MRRRRAIARGLHGHYWTLGSFVRGVIAPLVPPSDEPFVARFDDPIAGTIEVTGRLAIPREGARDLVIALHGLGGDVGSRYMLLCARAALDAGAACLRLHLRGADRSGSDLYHAGLAEDLDAAIRSDALSRFERIFVIGYSLGGHVALRWAALHAGDLPHRVRALASICAPLDLAAGVRAIQRVDRRPYQFHVLRGLKRQYLAVAARHGEKSAIAPIAIRDLHRIRRITEWDDWVIAPRFGFRDGAHYYEAAGAGPHLPSITIPTLFVAAEADPMIPAATVRPALEAASDAVRVVWADKGGHVGFPDDLALGVAPDAVIGGLEREVLAWLFSVRIPSGV
jgi:predicted alpha/beta-fold hydrolase